MRVIFTQQSDTGKQSNVQMPVQCKLSVTFLQSMGILEEEWKHRARQHHPGIPKHSSVCAAHLNGRFSFLQLFSYGSGDRLYSWTGR